MDRRVPEDELFAGGAPGPGGHLQLRLLTADGLAVDEWLRLDGGRGRLIAMPLEAHVGRRQNYVLEATDSAGGVARATVTVQVSNDRPFTRRQFILHSILPSVL